MLVLFLAAGASAAPVSLTAEEAADGWLLLFDGTTTFGWDTQGKATAGEGGLVVGGDGKSGSAVTHARLHRYELRFDAEVVGRATFQLSAGDSAGATVKLGAGRQEWKVLQDATPDGEVRLLASRKEGEKWVAGPTAAGPGLTRPVGFSFSAPANSTLTLRSARVRPLGTTPLFDGKSLKGWKEAPGKKSVFAVTKEGWLNVKDGPGDLQTEGQWADFAFQCQCISNGKHLNSGIFFRCIPDKYQLGYEAQVRNEWEGDDRTKPVDFGTGAIYRRQPARKVVSTDGEWFTLTILARGNRLMTWVDGYPVADWLDERPADDNPRNGFKAGKGCISIQGHDPTTDLSFRAFRIAELPAEK
jgi:hypothetical protein